MAFESFWTWHPVYLIMSMFVVITRKTVRMDTLDILHSSLIAAVWIVSVSQYSTLWASLQNKPQKFTTFLQFSCQSCIVTCEKIHAGLIIVWYGVPLICLSENHHYVAPLGRRIHAGKTHTTRVFYRDIVPYRFWIIWKWNNVMASDALAPCRARITAAVILMM